MLLPKSLVLIAVIFPMVTSTADVANRKKRTVSYAVEGCFSKFPAPASQDGWAVRIQTSDVKTRAEIKVTYWLRRKALYVFAEIPILKAKKLKTVNAPPNAEYGQPVMDHKVVVVDQVHIL